MHDKIRKDCGSLIQRPVAGLIREASPCAWRSLSCPWTAATDWSRVRGLGGHHLATFDLIEIVMWFDCYLGLVDLILLRFQMG